MIYHLYSGEVDYQRFAWLSIGDICTISTRLCSLRSGLLYASLVLYIQDLKLKIDQFFTNLETGFEYQIVPCVARCSESCEKP